MSENTVYCDSFDKSIYKLSWYQLPSDEQLVNKEVLLQSASADEVNIDMTNKLQLSYSNTYGKGINPDAIQDIYEALEFCRSVIKSQGMFDRSEQIAFEKASAAIEKAKLH